MYLVIYLFISLFIHSSEYIFIYLYIYLCIYMSIDLCSFDLFLLQAISKNIVALFLLLFTLVTLWSLISLSWLAGHLFVSLYMDLHTIACVVDLCVMVHVRTQEHSEVRRTLDAFMNLFDRIYECTYVHVPIFSLNV